MKRSVSLETWQLVHSLSSTEKAYFKKSLASRSDGKLKAVFDIINKLTEFDEALMVGRVKDAYSDVSGAYRLLRTTIMRRLVQFHASSSPLYEVNQLLAQARLAKEKRLFPLCNRLIDRGIRLSEENEFHLFRYMFWELKMEIPAKEKAEEVDRYAIAHERMTLSVEFAKVEADLTLLQYKEQQFNRWEKLTKQRYDDFQQLISVEELLENAERLEEKGTLRSATRLRIVVMAYYYSLGNWERSLELGMRVLDKMDDPVKMSDRNFGLWRITIGNMLGLSLLAYSKKGYDQLLTRLTEACKKRNYVQTDRAVGNLRIHHIGHLINQGKLETAITELDDLTNGPSAETLGPHLDLSAIQLNTINVKFLQEDYSDVLLRCADFLSSKVGKLDVRSSYSVRWVELAATYMMGDAELFKTKHASMQRFLKQYDSGFEWETRILSLLKESFFVDANPSDVLDPLLADIKPVSREVRVCVLNFDLLMWLESVSQNRLMVEVVKQRYLA